MNGPESASAKISIAAKITKITCKVFIFFCSIFLLSRKRLRIYQQSELDRYGGNNNLFFIYIFLHHDTLKSAQM